MKRLEPDEQLYKDCYKEFGVDFQHDMLIEECAELIQAVNHIIS